MAGANLPIGVGVANVMRFAGLDLATAVGLATSQPAKLLGLPAAMLAEGATADLVLFDLPEDSTAGLGIRATILAGEVVHGSVN